MKSAAPIPGYCVLKCMQMLYDSQCCSVCEIDTDFWGNAMENKRALLEKRKLEFCLGRTSRW